MSIFGLISAGIGLAGGIAGQNEANAAAKKQWEFQRKQARINNRYQRKRYKYDWNETKRDYQFALEGVDIARQNEAAERNWRDQTAMQDWQYSMAIRDYEYKNQMRAYNKSEQTYRQQLNYNNMAADVAKESEDRFLEERFIETAFQNQDIMVQMLQEEGQAALLQPGKSTGKAVQAVLAQAGRNQAILAESLTSAKKQYAVNLKKIQTDKFGADIQAEANRMLKPEMMPALPKPMPLPKAIFQDPRKPNKPPKPPKQLVPSAPTSSSAGYYSAAAGFAGNLAGIDWKNFSMF